MSIPTPIRIPTYEETLPGDPVSKLIRKIRTIPKLTIIDQRKLIEQVRNQVRNQKAKGERLQNINLELIESLADLLILHPHILKTNKQILSELDTILQTDDGLTPKMHNLQQIINSTAAATPNYGTFDWRTAVVATATGSTAAATVTGSIPAAAATGSIPAAAATGSTPTAATPWDNEDRKKYLLYKQKYLQLKKLL